MGLKPKDVTVGDTALSLANAYDHADVMCELLKHKDKVDVNEKSKLDKTPLMLASERGHLLVVQKLSKHVKVDVNAKCSIGNTAQMWAGKNGHV